MKKIIAILVVVVLLAGLGYFAYQRFLSSGVDSQETNSNSDQQTQVEDPKTEGWEVYSEAKYGFELKYPNGFFDENQLPRAFVGDCNYKVFPGQCPNINNPVMNDMVMQGADLAMVKNNFQDSNYWDDPKGTKQTINNTQYCLFSNGNAGAGHVFYNFYFATVKENKCFIVYLTTDQENCDNYLPLESGNTEQGREYNNCLTKNENQPKILDTVISTFKFKK